MTSRTTAVLVAVTALLVIYVIALEPKGGNAGRDFAGVPVETAEGITGLAIRGASGTIALERTERGWDMTSPVNDRADAARVDELVAALIELKKLDSLEDDTPPDATLGLAGNPLTITLTAPGGEEIGTLAFGDSAGSQGAVYARWGDDAPFICWQDARDLAAVPHDALRDPKLFGVKVEDIRRVKVKEESEASVVVDQVNREMPWMVTKPLKTLADLEAVEARLAVISNLSAKAFIDKPNGDVTAAFADGARTLSIWRHGARGPTDLQMAKSADGARAFAKISDREATFAIDPRAVDAFNIEPADEKDVWMSPNSLRDRRLLPFNPKSVLQLEIHAKPDHHVSLAQFNEIGWALVDGEEKIQANRQRVYAVLKALSVEPVEEFIADAVGDLSPYGLDNPTLSITLGIVKRDAETPIDDEGNPVVVNVPVTIDVKKELPEGQSTPVIFATVRGSGTVVRLSNAFPSIIPIRPLAYRSPYLWPAFNLASLRSIKTSRPPTAALELDYLFETNEWIGTLAGDDVSALIDNGQALRLAQELSLPLRAKDWVSGDTGDAERALLNPTKRVEFTLADAKGEEVTFRLDIAPTNPEVVGSLFYARVAGQREICILDREIFETLDLPLIKTQPRRPSPAPR